MIRNRFAALVRSKSMAEGRALSVPTLARELGMSSSLIYSWMDPDGISRFDGRTLERLCDYFKCPLGSLLVRVDDQVRAAPKK